jgi:proline dehydrogenase
MSHRSRVRDVPERAMRSLLLTLSHRRWLGRLATRLPITRPMVARFVAGESLDAALPAIERLRAAGFRTTVDVLGESVTAPDAARAAADSYLEVLDALAAGGFDRNVSLKLTQMGLRVDPALARANVARIVERAAIHGAFVRIDMEDHAVTDATLDLWRAVRPDPAARATTGADVGVVIQAALRRSPADVDRILEERGRIRLCKGAYREPSRVALQAREDVDAAFEALMLRLLRDDGYHAIASHDERLIARATAVARAEGIDPGRFEFQMLFGVRRDLQERLVREGWTVRVYVPLGREWYPYFMRRLAERPANVAFLLRTMWRERRGGRPSSGS